VFPATVADDNSFYGSPLAISRRGRSKRKCNVASTTEVAAAKRTSAKEESSDREHRLRGPDLKNGERSQQATRASRTTVLVQQGALCRAYLASRRRCLRAKRAGENGDGGEGGKFRARRARKRKLREIVADAPQNSNRGEEWRVRARRVNRAL